MADNNLPKADIFTPKFSPSLVARFPALQNPNTQRGRGKLPQKGPRQPQQHTLLKRVAKPLVTKPHEAKHLDSLKPRHPRRKKAHSFSEKLRPPTAAKLLKNTPRRSSVPGAETMSEKIDKMTTENSLKQLDVVMSKDSTSPSDKESDPHLTAAKQQ